MNKLILKRIILNIMMLLLSASAKKDRNFVCGVLKPPALSLVTKHTDIPPSELHSARD